MASRLADGLQLIVKGRKFRLYRLVSMASRLADGLQQRLS